MGIKYAVDEGFFDTWNSDMAYVLGYLYADGSLEDASYIRGRYIRVTSVEKKSIERVRDLLQSAHTIVPRKSNHKNGKMLYQLRIGSHRLYERLTEIGLRPNKSLTMEMPAIPARHLASFVRGYFDGDGCVHLERYPDKTSIRRMRVIFTSGSVKFLKELAARLRKHAGVINTSTIRGYHGASQLRYGTRDSSILFEFMYSGKDSALCLRRKKDTFVKYFAARAKRVHTKRGSSRAW